MMFGSMLAMLVIGAVAGWLAGKIVEGSGLGLIGNMAVGVAGAFLAGLMLPALGIGLAGGTVGAILHATIGAVILLVFVRLLRRA
jgi:uncharacterized membrane protein YeaQ/YmgE (transglycosylase-associated protein family)